MGQRPGTEAWPTQAGMSNDCSGLQWLQQVETSLPWHIPGCPTAGQGNQMPSHGTFCYPNSTSSSQRLGMKVKLSY